jgi:hypothetical protein
LAAAPTVSGECPFKSLLLICGADGELKWIAAMYAGLDPTAEEGKENSSVECTIQQTARYRYDCISVL